MGRQGVVAESGEEGGGENGAFQGLGDGVGGEEKALVEEAVVGEGGAQFAAAAGGGAAAGGPLDQVGAAGDIAAGRGDAARRGF